MKQEVTPIGGVEYSSEERVIGSWFGKPLYQITLRLQYPTVSTDGIGTARTVDVSNLHIALGWVVQNVTEGSSSSTGAWGAIGVQTVAKYYTRIGCNPSNNEIYLQTNRSAMSNIYVYTTIQYTKTTD